MEGCDISNNEITKFTDNLKYITELQKLNIQCIILYIVNNIDSNGSIYFFNNLKYISNLNELIISRNIN